MEGMRFNRKKMRAIRSKIKIGKLVNKKHIWPRLTKKSMGHI